ncbi:hypothetical protein BZG02_12030 [Labilibaculum filiforme]|uniref:Uncharacterized protein n=1 Tax=Labilibaculum filiforme TaxID=1940526 RepID=A0A2N3HWQ0_9BACT|nr:hypothetical protein [Labilibaculum filiforme]PKQ62453.1 hypothetical protein BZG02_12030 [Labilibaculum filiforme]
MNKRNNSLWKLSLILIVLFSWTTESNAQYISTITKQYSVLSPIVKIISNTIWGSNTKVPTIQTDLENEKSYFNSKLFFFEENMQVCKDILNDTKDSVAPLHQSSQQQEQTHIEKDTVLILKKTKIVEKKKHKSIWNNPGNTNTRI